jgi:hypothetical protein
MGSLQKSIQSLFYQPHLRHVSPCFALCLPFYRHVYLIFMPHQRIIFAKAAIGAVEKGRDIGKTKLTEQRLEEFSEITYGINNFNKIPRY